MGGGEERKGGSETSDPQTQPQGSEAPPPIPEHVIAVRVMKMGKVRMASFVMCVPERADILVIDVLRKTQVRLDKIKALGKVINVHAECRPLISN